ncbi:MAG: hypothetical protein KBD56_02485 [Candidatus Eisenbacteria bacterium]|nr:hypothetical protein [Candidatus Eisenbacteria bacterium]
MSTFVVHFIDESGTDFRGMVRHVANGEESRFASERELLAFFERMNRYTAFARANAEWLAAHRAVQAPGEGDTGGEPPARAASKGQERRGDGPREEEA